MKGAEGTKTAGINDITTLIDEYHSAVGVTKEDEYIITDDIHGLLSHVVSGGGVNWRLKELNLALGPLRKGDFIVITARPDCISGSSKVRVIRGIKGYEAHRSSRIYSLEKLEKLQRNNPLPMWIMCMNESTKELSYKEIDALWASGEKEVITVATDNNSIECTKEHLIYTQVGWKKASELKVNEDYILVRDYSKSEEKLSTHRKELCTKLPFSPYKIRVVSGYTYNRVAEARLVYDAGINRVSVELFLEQLKTNPSHGFIFSPTKGWELHHIDNDPTNNVFDNLVLLTKEQHKKLHGLNENFSQNKTKLERVIAITNGGTKECFDISMKGADKNFLVNDCIVHNCGKTTMLASESSFIAPQLPKEQHVIWFNNEEEGRKVKFRVIQAAIGWTTKQIQDNPLKAYELYEKEVGSLDRILIYDRPAIHTKDVRKVLDKYDVGLIIFDQLRKVKGFEKEGGNDVGRLQLLFQEAREWAKEYAPVINVHQARGDAEGQRYIELNQMHGSQTDIQGEADAVVALGRTHEPGFEKTRFLYVPKNKLAGGPLSDEKYRNGKFELIIEPEIARFKGVL